MSYIVDASVALKWFVTEEDSELALQLREAQLVGRTDLMAPDLLLYEVAHVLVRKKSFAASEARDAVEALLSSGMDLLAPDGELMGEAIRLADALRLSVYDACYAALAAQTGATLVTCDRDHLAMKGHVPDVRLLRHITP